MDSENSKKNEIRKSLYYLIYVQNCIEYYNRCYLMSTSNGQTRHTYTEYEKKFLNDYFKIEKYPIPSELQSISRHLKIDIKKIRTWFNNRRANSKIFKSIKCYE